MEMLRPGSWRPWQSRPWTLWLGGVVVLVAVLLVWFLCRVFLTQPVPIENLPLIAASTGPVRTRPSSDGSPQILYQDRKIYGNLDKTKPKTSNTGAAVEELLPPEEVPLIEDVPLPQASLQLPPSAAVPASPATGAEAEEVTGVRQLRDNARPLPSPPPPSSAATSIDQLLKQITRAPLPTLPPPPVFRKSGRYSLQLGSLPTQDLAEKEWRRIANLSKEWALFQQRPNFQRVDLGVGRGVVYRILLKGLASKKEAQSLCQQLKKRKISCHVVVVP